MTRRVLKGKWVVANLPRGGVTCGYVEARVREPGRGDVLHLHNGYDVVVGDVIKDFSDELAAHEYKRLCLLTRA
jgi:hypothetical protein